MSQHLRPDPATPGQWVWTYPRLPALFAAAGLGLCAILALALTGAFIWAVLIVASEGTAHPASDLMGLAILGAGAAVLCVLTDFKARDLTGKWHGSIAVTDTHLTLDLAGHRSLMHAPAGISTRLALADIESIQTRLESYSNVGLNQMQRAYRLLLRDGSGIFLFEQRALGTDLVSSEMDGLAEALAQRMGVPVLDLGMVEGRLGFLGFIGGAAAPWIATPLSGEREQRLWRRAVFTGSFPAVVMLAALVFNALV